MDFDSSYIPYYFSPLSEIPKWGNQKVKFINFDEVQFIGFSFYGSCI